MPSLREVLHQRRAVSNNRDGFKVALVIEGGAMRGVVAGGMISALESLGFNQAFDVVVGTSAGAIAACYLLANQARLGPRIYYEDLTDHRWTNYFRPIFGKTLWDFEYLFDEVIGGTKELDTRAVLESNTRLLVTATRRSDWTALVIEPKTPKEVLSALKASSRVPVIGGGAIKVNGEDCLDGSITVSIPFKIVLEQAPTHILVLLTHPHGESISSSRPTAFRMLDIVAPGLGRMQALRNSRYLSELKAIRESESAQTMVIRPNVDVPAVGFLECNADRLYAGAETGAEAVFKAFGCSPTDEDLAELLNRPPRRSGGLDDCNYA